jgi:peptide/nickel transport system permease protein
MGRYIIRRVLQAIPLLFLLSIGMFGLIHLIPGGADAVLFNPHLTAEARAALRVRMGLDDPFYLQYVKWISSALTGNFGYSFNTNEPVSVILARRFPATLELFGTAFFVALTLAILIGVISAVRQGTLTDYSLTILAYIGISLPVFLLGLFLQDIFGVWLHWLPTSGTGSYGVALSPLFALQYDRGSETRLYAHGACEGRGVENAACASWAAQRSDPLDYDRRAQFWRSGRWGDDHRGRVCLAGSGVAVS